MSGQFYIAEKGKPFWIWMHGMFWKKHISFLFPVWWLRVLETKSIGIWNVDKTRWRYRQLWVFWSWSNSETSRKKEINERWEYRRFQFVGCLRRICAISNLMIGNDYMLLQVWYFFKYCKVWLEVILVLWLCDNLL